MDLINAINEEKLDDAIALIDKLNQEDLAFQDEEGTTSLMVAIENNKFKLAELLIKKMRSEDLGLQDSSGYTALNYAIFENNVPIVKLLVEKMDKKDLVKRDGSGFTPLMLVSYEKGIDEKIAELLIENIDPKDLSLKKDGKTALNFAQDQGNLKVVKLFGIVVEPHLLNGVDTVKQTFEIRVDKTDVFDSLFETLHDKIEPYPDSKKLKITFIDDFGVDAGGVLREMYSRLKDDLVRKYIISKPLTYYTISYDPEINLQMKFLGNLVAQAIFIDRVPMDINFDPIVLYLIIHYTINSDIEIGDISRLKFSELLKIFKKYDPYVYDPIMAGENLDPIFNKLNKLNEINNEEEWKVRGKLPVYNPNTFEMEELTDIFANKDNFLIKILIKMVDPYFENLKSIIRGFLHIAPKDKLKRNINEYFEYYEKKQMENSAIFAKIIKDLNDLIEGINKIFFDDFKNEVERNTELKNDEEKKIFSNFWNIVKINSAKNAEYLNSLFRFWTGYSSLPYDGFKNKELRRHPINISFQKVLADNEVVAHSCVFNIEIKYSNIGEITEYLKKQVLPFEVLSGQIETGFTCAGGTRTINNQYYDHYKNYKNKYMLLKEKLRKMLII